MKKRILLGGLIQFFLVLNGCSSDSGNDSGSNPGENGEVVVDYVAEVASTDDFIVNSDNTVYQIGQKEGVSLKKIDLEGNFISLMPLTYSFLKSKLSISKSGEILLINPFSDLDYSTIYRFDNNFSEVNSLYTMKPVSSPFANKTRLLSICNNNDNTYFVFDYGNRQIKRFLPELSADVFVAGSEKSEIKDGTGLNAGFSVVTKIVPQNNILYLIDNLDTGNGVTFFSSNIRKLEYVNNEWKVTTLISSTTDTYTDIAFDSKNELYVLIKEKGIFKLNLLDNTLSSFKEGQFEFKKDNHHYSFPSSYIKAIKIKGDDLYVTSDTFFIKISDFQVKFAAANK